ncbi:DUF1835 domain-containing protein [Bacillus sp. Xin]|uniref:DUF1835 domain-containing protein n=1 Tax=unclassified Bacillus (in: firmicutes) TaxID=185979 RepID=UPI001572D4F4|nr:MULTISPECIES: DUF1835 domain-containing protein [unclassified Bacillus (in: firmicutes)]MBC6973342.1 DUF1835 domain-containing protein [Bacillus sp. Xin]NSW35655.1 DUF1835 domain-containing protein [Bacillus sp. Xin1]
MIDKLSEVIENMPEDEAKSLLRLILIQLDLMETEPSENRMTILTEIPKQLIESQKPKLHIKESKHVHIAFGDSPAGCIKYMLKQASLTEDYVILFSDAFSIGPIHQLELEAGQVARQQWLSRNLNSYDLYFEEEYLSTFRQSMEELQSIPQDIPITIWKANNTHEHVGLCFVLAHLQDRDNIHVINTSEARELFPEGYDIRATGELSPEQLAIIYEKYENSALLSEEERKGFEQEWKLLSETTDLLRIWNENKVQSVQEDYFDSFIVECAEKLKTARSFCKAPRLIGEVLGHIEQVIGDIFLEYRLRTLIQQGVFEMEGTLKAMRYYSVKLKKSH